MLGGSPSDQLKEVYKPVLSDADCLTNIGGAFHAPTMTCAGYIAGGQGACAVIFFNILSKSWTQITLTAMNLVIGGVIIKIYFYLFNK